MPDIDIDFCYERREEVIDYVKRKYGEDHVAQIITFGTMGAKAAIRDVGRVLDIPYNKVDKIAKEIPFALGMTIDKALETNPTLRDLYLSLIHILPSAGSTFKRPEGHFAAKLIDDSGLRGLTLRGAQVSEKHCGFVVNLGNAKAKDILDLMYIVKSTVKSKYGITLEEEVKILGED